MCRPVRVAYAALSEFNDVSARRDQPVPYVTEGTVNGPTHLHVSLMELEATRPAPQAVKLEYLDATVLRLGVEVRVVVGRAPAC
jgi:hypothetical protein